MWLALVPTSSTRGRFLLGPDEGWPSASRIKHSLGLLSHSRVVGGTGYAHGPASGGAFAEGYGAPPERPQMPTTDFGMPEILPSPPLQGGAGFVPQHPGVAPGESDLSFPPMPASSGPPQGGVVWLCPCYCSTPCHQKK